MACCGLTLPLQSPLHRIAISPPSRYLKQFFCIGFQTTTMSTEALVEIDLQDKLKRVASGKVRDVFEIDSETLLFVASDRISAYDVIMKNVSQGDILLPNWAISSLQSISRICESIARFFISFAVQQRCKFWGKTSAETPSPTPPSTTSNV